MHDFVIVGGGSAGCVLANRLSANGAKVLLLEAGKADKSFLLQMPVGFAVVLAKGWYDWGYVTEPQENLEGRRLPWLRGKVLGGSSSINAMVYIRGDRSDYDQWAQLGNSGWSFRECLPFFRKAENWADHVPDEFHGTGGPLGILRVPINNPLSKAWVEAGLRAGYPFNPDFCGPQLEGFGPADFTIAKNRRASAASAYLAPTKSRPNLLVKVNAHATRVIFENGRAVGVEYSSEGKLERAYASEEVIVSGGAINSPALLMHSGVGPADKLKRLGIDVKQDLPGVGQNLHDHLQSAIKWTALKPVSLYRNMRPANALINMARYAVFKSGPNSRMGLETMAFVKSDARQSGPDLQFYCSNYLFKEGSSELAKQHGFMIFYNHTRPQSRGYIELRSNDPMAPPIIQPNYLSVDEDVRMMRRGFQIAREIVGQSSFDGLRGDELSPGTSVVSDSEIDEYNRKTASTVYHPVGTCKMGLDRQAVVDPTLRVRGVDGLRVADASIMPAIVSANTNATVIMIGEKAATMILDGQKSITHAA